MDHLGQPLKPLEAGAGSAAPPRRLLFTAIAAAALAIAAPPALAWQGPPKASPPTAPSSGAPPPAWIETQAQSAWLFYGSYCWQTMCVDLIPPETRPSLPTFTVVRRRTVRVHLRFVATSATVSIDRRKVSASFNARTRIVSWSANRAGILTISARSAAGDASYVARLRVR
ncbi:MAG: hypothetical protein M3P41_13780 [Actinomycetota bacterium]|nr:hypothetical protein [Actinomycetota bacterium]